MTRALLPLLLLAACTSIDATQPARYACTRDAGGDADACPGGWKCGLAGFCIDPNVGAPVQCLDSATDCGGGWHCGVAGTCYDLGDAGAVACRPDGGDCATGWRCGLSTTCHDTALAAPLACAVDSDCEQSWRCGPDGRCVDSHEDALRPNASLAAPSATLLNPLLPQQTPDFVATATGYISGCDSEYTDLTTVTMSYGPKVTRWHRYGHGLAVDCTAQPPVRVDGDLAETTLPGDVIALADDGSSAYAVVTGGTLYTLSFARPTLTATATAGVPTGLGAKGVRAYGFSSDPQLVVFGDHRVALLSKAGVWSQAITLPVVDGGTPTIADLDVVNAPIIGPQVVAATEVGLLLAPTTALEANQQAWRPAWQQCGAKFVPPVVRLGALSGPTGAFVGVIYQSEFPPSYFQPLLFSFSVNDAGTDCSPPLGGSPPVFVQHSGSCGPCIELVDAAAHTLPDGGPVALLRCSDPMQPGLQLHRCDLAPPGGSGYDLADLATHEGARLSGTGTGPLASVDEFGSLWLLPQVSDVSFQSAMLNDVPSAVAGTAQTIAAEYQPSALDTAGTYAKVSAAALQSSPGFGVNGDTLTDDYPLLLSGVAGRPTWQVMALPTFPSTVPVFDTLVPGRFEGGMGERIVATTPGPLASPVNAVTAPSADGGMLLIITSGDLLSAGDVTQTSDGGIQLTSPSDVARAPKVTFAVAPLPHSQITSIVALAPDADAGAAWSRGYLVASGRVFAVRADGPVVWRADEITITPAEAVSVWADGTRARVGFRDGSVFTLPSRVRVAPPIASGASTAVTFAGVGCRSFALSTSGLYELVDDGAVEGSWNHVPLSSDDAGIGFARGALYSDGEGLAVFREHGFVERVSIAPCP